MRQVRYVVLGLDHSAALFELGFGISRVARDTLPGVRTVSNNSFLYCAEL